MNIIIETFKNLPAPAMYFAIAVIIFGLIVVILRIIKFIKSASRILNTKSFLRNPQGSVITPMQQTAINIGAINGEQMMSYTNSLATGIPRQELAQKLMEYYGIGPMGTSAATLLNWLQNEGHRVLFEPMRHAFVYEDEKTWKNTAKTVFSNSENAERSLEFLNNLNESIDTLIKEGFIKKRSDIEMISVLAWDLGRLVSIARCSYDCNYISKDEAWKYINTALSESRTAYNNWEDLALGYVVGRAMWGGNSLSFGGIIDITKKLLESEESPWKHVSLK